MPIFYSGEEEEERRSMLVSLLWTIEFCVTFLPLAVLQNAWLTTSSWSSFKVERVLKKTLLLRNLGEDLSRLLYSSSPQSFQVIIPTPNSKAFLLRHTALLKLSKRLTWVFIKATTHFYCPWISRVYILWNINIVISTALKNLGSKYDRLSKHWLWSGYLLSPKCSGRSGSNQCVLEGNGEPWLIWQLGSLQ